MLVITRGLNTIKSNEKNTIFIFRWFSYGFPDLRWCFPAHFPMVIPMGTAQVALLLAVLRAARSNWQTLGLAGGQRGFRG